MSALSAALDVSSWGEVGTWRQLGPGMAAAAAVAVAGGLLARRAGATALAVLVAAAAMALTLAAVSVPASPRALASHLLILLAFVLTVRPRTAPAEAALGLVAALAAGVLSPGAWLLGPAVPAAALAGGDARHRRFVGSALAAVALPAAGLGAALLWAQRWSVPWPPADIDSLVSVLALPGLVATLAAAAAAGLSAGVRVGQRRHSDATPLPTGRPLGLFVAVVATTVVAAVLGGLGTDSTGRVAEAAAAPGPEAGDDGDDPARPGADGAGPSQSGPAGPSPTGTAGPLASPAPTGGATTAAPAATGPPGDCPPVAAPVPGSSADPALAAAAAELRQNPNITLCEGSAAALDAGQVDGRLLALLALLADGHTFRVDEIAGSAAALSILESVTGSDAPAADAALWLRAQRGPYAPATVEVLGRGGLYVEYGEIPGA